MYSNILALFLLHVIIIIYMISSRGTVENVKEGMDIPELDN